MQGDDVNIAEKRTVDPEDAASAGAVWESGARWGLGFNDYYDARGPSRV